MGCIAAMLSLDGAPIDERLLDAMMDVPPYHRSPNRRSRIAGEVGLAFAPLRLDACEAATPQPFGVHDSLWAVFDGRLDDRPSLVAALRRGRPFEGTMPGDVELAMRAYEIWGADCVRHLMGDFAFCVWDARRRELFCARDHMGVKPFYYARAGNTIVFANALRSIRRHPRVGGQLRDQAVVDLLLFGCSQDESATLFADVSRLPPAHSLTCALPDGSLRVARYWSLQPEEEIRYRDSRDYVAHFEDRFKAAVTDRIREPRIGILMSGGLDSSSVGAITAEALGTARAPAALRAYTAVYDRLMRDDERRYSSMMARWLGISIEHLPVDSYTLFGRWDDEALPPEPSTEPLSAIMTDLLDRASIHAPAVLTGDGGDPLLLPSTVLSQVSRVPIPTLTRDLWRCVGTFRRRPPFGLRSAVQSWWRPEQNAVPKWLSPTLLANVDVQARWEALRTPPRTRSARADAIAGVLTPYWASTFEHEDPSVTQRPVEVRHPFFDVRLLSFALRLPSLPWCVNKTILRSAMRGRLPEAIRERPKTALAADPAMARTRWTVGDAMRLFAAAPGIDRYVDLRKFESLVRPEGLLTDDEPGTVAALGLAAWLRYSSEGARISHAQGERPAREATVLETDAGDVWRHPRADAKPIRRETQGRREGLQVPHTIRNAVKAFR